MREWSSPGRVNKVARMRIPFFLILGFVLLTSAHAQSDLARGETVEGHLELGEVDEYFIDLSAEQFVFGEVDQLNVDAKVTVLDPENQVTGNFNTSARGADPIQFETSTNGRYTIRVASAGDQPGRYSIAFQRIEDIAVIPERRLDQLLAAFEGDDEPGAVVAVIREKHRFFLETHTFASKHLEPAVHIFRDKGEYYSVRSSCLHSGAETQERLSGSSVYPAAALLQHGKQVKLFLIEFRCNFEIPCIKESYLGIEFSFHSSLHH